MTVQDLLARRSVRKYTDRPVPEAVVRAALEAAMAAPSAMHCDPWRWLVLTKRADLDALADCLPYGQMLRHAPLGFIACGDLTAANRGELSYLLQDVSASIENLLLALHAQGLGGVWLGIHPNVAPHAYSRERRSRRLPRRVARAPHAFRPRQGALPLRR